MRMAEVRWRRRRRRRRWWIERCMLNEGRCNSTYGSWSLLNRAAARASLRKGAAARAQSRSGGGSNSHASSSAFVISRIGHEGTHF
jgi:hypothetical protein